MGRELGGDRKGPCHRNQSKTASRGVPLKDQVLAQGPRWRGYDSGTKLLPCEMEEGRQTEVA